MYETRIIEKDLDNCEDLEDFVGPVIPRLRSWRAM